MISSEKAFDILPYVSDIYEKLNLNKYIKDKKVKLKKGENVEIKLLGIGLDMFSYVMKNSPKVKNEVFEIVAILEDKTLEEVKEQPFSQTISTIKGLYEDKETVDFLKSAVE